ncbi:MAG: bifunctional protein-serine/threonine kinase/phosphatase [Sulfuricurvum sp.]|uniref:bifunctional protein-serine/threonine kinase/phosphatase n=1 Tax=Sulfuricurvum sp. TaxID=2025608 RepID=UPI002628A30E|nr:bifunctional protein-serine/threonine kinase/phosphatase [Sulfuricurvum sp.]MDD5158498.1 bifunctional protein-serine/threonine kinase/phosphatase [Sulfuricurvum sp.]
MLAVQASEYLFPKPHTTGDDACAYTIIDNALLVSVLCDGVGSAKRGGTAARQCVKFFIDQFKNRPKAWDIPKTMEVFTRHINSLLFKESMAQYGQIELLTTLCLAIIEGETLYTLNLGDSRIYLLTAEGEFRRLSNDHTMDDEYLSHVLTQACGLSENIDPVIMSTPIAIGDTLILCSDGVYNLLDEKSFFELLKKGLGSSTIIQHAAQTCEPSDRDDMSLQIFRIESLDPLHAIKNIPLPIPETLSVGEIIDGYTLISPMMEHGRIWKVTKEEQTYVMKFPMSNDEEALDAFVREAWVAKQITHKAFGHAWVPEVRSMRYYLMELVEGVNLQEYLKNRPLSVDNAIALGKFLHRAEAHLLHLGLVHGDIKPENILVYQRDGEAGVEFKMVDFGSIVEIFSTNSRAGTPTYLAPERFSGSVINESTEIFSIGVTLYWALTGEFPYGEIEPFQNPTFKKAKNPIKLNSNIPLWLDSVIMRSIAITPDMRYRHYSEFFYELKSPEKVKPFFCKETQLIERSPVTFYKIGFFILLALETLTFWLYVSK